MKFVNKTEKKIKVVVEGTKPRAFTTLKKGDMIEVKSMVYSKYYKDVGLEEVKAFESKAGPVKIETKVLEKEKPKKIVEELKKKIIKPIKTVKKEEVKKFK